MIAFPLVVGLLMRLDVAAICEAPPPATGARETYEECVQKWQRIVAPANAELAAPPPALVAGCEEKYVAWQVATRRDPSDYEAMVERLDLRAELERCGLDHRASRLQKLQDSAWAELLTGGTLSGVGVSGLIVIGAVALDAHNRGISFGPVGTAMMGFPAITAAALTVTGAIILGFGLHHRKLARAAERAQR